MYIAVEEGELVVATRKSRCQGPKRVPEPNREDISQNTHQRAMEPVETISRKGTWLTDGVTHPPQKY